MFLHTNFTQAFVKRYRQHRIHILWSQQIYQLPIVTDYIAQEQLEKEKYQEGQRIEQQLKKTRHEILKLKFDRSKEGREKKKELKQQRSTYYTQIQDCNYQRWSHSSEGRRIFNGFVRDQAQQQQSSRKRERPCVTEDCKGFVDSEGNCPVCQKMTCLKCNVTKVDDTHVCSQVDVDTWNDLKKNTVHVRIVIHVFSRYRDVTKCFVFSVLRFRGHAGRLNKEQSTIRITLSGCFNNVDKSTPLRMIPLKL